MTHTVYHTGYSIVINLSEDDLGNPGRPGLWEEIYRPRPFVPDLLMCMEHVAGTTRCPGGMYVQVRDGKRVGVHNVRAEGEQSHGESDAHKALKDYVATNAERHGFSAQVEDASKDRKRRSDVLIDGAGGRRIGWEIQLSRISPGTVVKRRKIAEGHGLTPMWTVNDPKAAPIDRAPWTRINPVEPHTIRAGNALLIRGGVRNLHMGRCDGRIYTDVAGQRLPCSNRRQCTGWHPDFFPVEGARLDEMTGLIPGGEYVPIYVKTWRGGHYFWITPRARADYLHGSPEPTPPQQDDPSEPDTLFALDEPKPVDPTCTWHRDTGWRPEPTPSRDRNESIYAESPRPVVNITRPGIPRLRPGICGAGTIPCGAPARLYPCGWRCDVHSPGRET